jgi:protein-disulfide isomerase
MAWVAAVLALSITVGCKAQDAGSKSSVQDPALARKIEVLVRGQFNIPADYSMTLGTRKPSNIPGYDSLEVTVARNGRSTPIQFLLATDNKSLAKLETFDLTKLPSQNISVENRPIRGNPEAKVTVINFDDLECPYCARMHQELFPRTLDRYKDKVRFIYKDDPLVEIHPWALRAAVDSGCLGEQNNSAYWGYVDYLHAHGQEVTGEDRNVQKSYAVLDRIAKEQGKIFSLDSTKLDACLQKQDETAVRASMKDADALGIEGTPFLFVDGERINGALPAEQVWAVIDRALRAAGVAPPVSPAASAPLPAPTLTN